MTNGYETTIKAEPGKQTIEITREFDAPRELVFRAFTDPELYAEWLGPRELTMTLETFEPRDGGAYRYLHTRLGRQRVRLPRRLPRSDRSGTHHPNLRVRRFAE